MVASLYGKSLRYFWTGSLILSFPFYLSCNIAVDVKVLEIEAIGNLESDKRGDCVVKLVKPSDCL
jgi:hypothetical protein